MSKCEIWLDHSVLGGICTEFCFLPQMTIVSQQQEVQFLPLGGTGVNGMLCDNLIKLFLSTARGKLQHSLKFKDLISITKNISISS